MTPVAPGGLEVPEGEEDLGDLVVRLLQPLDIGVNIDVISTTIPETCDPELSLLYLVVSTFQRR